MTAFCLALLAGAVVGLSLGALGAGGSVLTVPALIYFLNFTPQQATTASLLIVLVTSLMALFTHARAGTVRWRLGLLFAAAGTPPAAVAATYHSHIPPQALTAAFSAITATAAIVMLRKPTPTEQVRPVRAAGVGAGLGALTGFLGIGGGFLTVPALVSALAVPMTTAVGTSLLVISINATTAFAVRLGTVATLNWALIAPFAATALLGAWDGKRLATKLNPKTLQRLFAATLLITATTMLTDTLFL
ncbi:sulfite exporter TauE/SafE family protein [Saccharothrix sp.]|uniref:sulfite exporter TauE/SafE family protein n=1 Tax=Saccharothrix sp. TaxID=1873460 RepID=UPI002811651B|nr:sulfite exporter TauE/SafE family protein [Saccharothrix sp.]